MRSPRPLVVVSCAAVLLLATASRALAWSSTGHMITAAIAYRALSPELRSTYAALLTAHPAHAEWRREYEGGVDEGGYLFMRAAVWPDELKRGRGGIDAHPEWHYVNHPLTPPSFEVGAPLPSPNGNIELATAENRAILADERRTAPERAIALAWLLHLIGDLHQPLHVVALVDGTYPSGDRGGNDFFVRATAESKPVSLHYFWDALLGTSNDPRAAWNDAIVIETMHGRPMLPELATAPTLRDWSVESRAAAIDAVYLRGRLAGVADRSADAPVVPESYPRDANSVAQRRAALAGYRLGDLLGAAQHADAE